MASRGGPRRVLLLFSLLGVAAIVAAIVLLLGIQRKLIKSEKAQDAAEHVENAKQRCEILKRVLRERLDALVARHPEATSFSQFAGEVERELAAFRALQDTGQGIHVIVVDEKLRTLAALDPAADADLGDCTRHVRDEDECVYTLPRHHGTSGSQPRQLFYACPIRRDGRLLGGIVIRKDIDKIGDPFGALTARMTWTVLVSQSVLLFVLAAIAVLARRSVAEAERRRAEDERLAALGNLAAGIAHEIRNPLNTISLTCRFIERLISQSSQDHRLRAEVNKNFEIVAGELGRLTRTLDDFLLLAKPTALDLADCEVDDLVDGALALFSREFEAARVQLVRRRGGPLPIAADADRLRQVFVNIIKNSIQAMPEGGSLTVATERADGQARVTFADTGPGIAPAHIHRVFEPYFSTKRSGLGLGLSLSQRIVSAHQGAIGAANQPGGGAVFTVSLPLHSPAPEGSSHAR